MRLTLHPDYLPHYPPCTLRVQCNTALWLIWRCGSVTPWSVCGVLGISADQFAERRSCYGVRQKHSGPICDYLATLMDYKLTVSNQDAMQTITM